MQGSHSKRIILLISDGDDNASRRSSNTLKQYLKESEVIFYSLGIFDSRRFSSGGFLRQRSNLGREVLKDFSSFSGGQAFFPEMGDQLNESLIQFSKELRCYYTIGFIPPDMLRDGKWHELQVKLTESKEAASGKSDKERLKVCARQGYRLGSAVQKTK